MEVTLDVSVTLD